MKKIFTLLLIAVTLCSCSDDDNNSSKRLNGTWQMTELLSYTDAPAPVLAPGDITWNVNTNTLSIVNNSDDAPFPATGTYQISVNAERLLIMHDDFDSYYRYAVTDSTLTLTEGEEGIQDGSILKFSRAVEE